MPYDDLRKGRFSAPQNIYFVTTVTHQRKPYFENFACGRVVISEMRRLHEQKLLNSFAWVLMPDHLHWLFQLGEGISLSSTMKLFKGSSARGVNKFLGQSGAVWQKAFYDHALRHEEDLRAVSRYMIENPLRAGLVKDIHQYSLWDSIWLESLCE